MFLILQYLRIKEWSYRKENQMNMKTNKVVIIDYRLGNLFSVNQACKNVGMNVVISSDPNIN